MIGGIAAMLLGACSGGEKQASEPANDMSTGAATGEPAPQAPATLASVTGNAADGQDYFLRCKICHSTEPGDNRIGPTLHGVIGRKAGAESSFVYSSAMTASGVTWTDEQLFAFLENPAKMVPGNKMAFAGISSAQTRADIIAYLKTVK